MTIIWLFLRTYDVQDSSQDIAHLCEYDLQRLHTNIAGTAGGEVRMKEFSVAVFDVHDRVLLTRTQTATATATLLDIDYTLWTAKSI